MRFKKKSFKRLNLKKQNTRTTTIITGLLYKSQNRGRNVPRYNVTNCVIVKPVVIICIFTAVTAMLVKTPIKKTRVKSLNNSYR
jgi:hypothetical protein